MEGKQPVYVDSEGNVLRDSREPVEYETPNYANNGYRLPTVAEWEYAARGAVPGSTEWNYTYVGGNSPDDYYWYNIYFRPIPTTQEVGLMLPNSIGLYDMGGNVNELVTLPDSEAAAVGHSFDFHASPLGYDCNPIYTDNFIQVTFIGDNKLHAQSSLGTYVTQGFRIMCAKE
jgi:formylglycine-generating enzyme required for sulfatase activity